MIVSPVHDVFPYLRGTYRLALIVIGSHIERLRFIDQLPDPVDVLGVSAGAVPLT